MIAQRLTLILVLLVAVLTLCSRGKYDECDGTHQVKFERCR